MKKEYGILVVFLVVLFISATLFFGKLQQDNLRPPEKIPNSTTADFISEPLNFQGQMNNVKLTDNGLTLDTKTSVEKDNITEGTRLAGATENAVYISREDGSTYRYSSGSLEKLDFNSLYGSIAGDFEYPGPNLVYANSNRDTYIMNLETGEKKKLFSDTIEVMKTDADQNGVPESATVVLMNGSKITMTPLDSRQREDWDGDGYTERFYIKNNYLYSYDSKHGEEKFTPANGFVIEGQNIYTVHDKQVSKLSFTQDYHLSGTYHSIPRTFNETTKIVQLITKSRLNGGRITGKITAGNKTKEFKLENGYTSILLDMSGQKVDIRFTLKTEEPDRTPVLQQYELLVRK